MRVAQCAAAGSLIVNQRTLFIEDVRKLFVLGDNHALVLFFFGHLADLIEFALLNKALLVLFEFLG